ncbi:uncharacterized protein TNCV_4427051 [Trichonephila clavipes]|nr:uncharacterized protein TNCV_4427051 [Trichonephila clavipes]
MHVKSVVAQRPPVGLVWKLEEWSSSSVSSSSFDRRSIHEVCRQTSEHLYFDSSASKIDTSIDSSCLGEVPNEKSAIPIQIISHQSQAAVAEWYRYRTVACFVTSSSPVPLKTRRVGQRCTLNLSRAQTSSRWCGVVVRRGEVPAQVSSTSLDHGSKLRGPSPKALV